MSTAIPAIKAWLSPTYRVVDAIKTLKKLVKLRRTAVMACIATNALDMVNVHVPVKVSSFSHI